MGNLNVEPYSGSIIKSYYIMEKKATLKGRDLGHNNVVKRSHINIYEHPFPRYIEDDRTLEFLQRIINKIEHKIESCEKFLAENQDIISLSYYTEGYYNGRVRSFEEILDTIEELLEDEYEKSFKR